MSVPATVERVLAPSTEAILGWLSVAEMKKHMRIFGTAEDDVIQSSILAAFSAIDGPRAHLQRAIIGDQDYTLTLDTFPSGEIVLPYPPVTEVRSVVYLDASGTSQTLASSSYVFTPNLIRPRLRPVDEWPETSTRPDSVVVSFIAGWDADDVPARIKHGAKLLAAHFFENREATFMDGRATDYGHEVPLGLRFLFDMDRVPNRYC